MEVEAMAERIWNKGKVHMKAGAGKCGQRLVSMGQGQGTYEGKSRGVEVITGYAWDKSRENMKARAGKWRQRQDAFRTRAGK